MRERGDDQGPLHGVRALDLAGEAGVFAGRMLAELGADVIRVEPPGGDPVRRRPPFLDDPAHADVSLYHLHFNAGKRSITLDLDREDEREALRRLVRTADIWIDTAAPGSMDALGLGYDALRADHPGLVYTTITPFGQDGPMRGYRGNDLVGVATGGLMYLNGFPEDPPNAPGAEQAYHMAAAAAAASTLIALAGRSRDPERRGWRVDVSVQEAASMATLQTANANIYTWHGDVPRRSGMSGPYGGQHLHQCRDGGWISFVIPVGSGPFWGFFVDWLRDAGVESEVTGEAWREPAFRAAHAATVRAAVAALVARYDRDDLFHEGQRRRLLVMPVNDERDLLADPQLRARDYFAAIEHPELGRTIEFPGAPYHFSRTPAGLRRRAPAPGEHDAEIRAELAGSAYAVGGGAASPDATAARPLPLAGLRVADFFWLIAGPATSRVLADLGAEVIKIESNTRIDNVRITGVQPEGPGSVNTNGVFADVNTNKRSVTLNLNTPRGIELAREIVRRSDIVTNNFTGDRMDRWGLGYEDLRALRPDVIMLTMPVMGTTGPYRRYGSYGNGVIGYGGLRTNMGFPGRPPVGIAPLYSDFSTPYFGVAALMAALHHRERTGEGQFIDLSQLEATVALLGTGIAEVSANGRVPGPTANRAPDYAPHGAYPCAGDDRWLAIAVRDDDDWRALCAAIGRPGLADDARFATLTDRKRHEDALDAEIATWTRTQDAWEATHHLQAHGVMAGVVEDLADMVTRDPHLSTMHFAQVSRDDEDVVFTQHRQPARFDGASPPLRAHPRMGADNEYVFKELLGIDDAEYVQLLADGVLD